MFNLDYKIQNHINLLIERYPILKDSKKSIIDSYLIMEECFNNDGKLLLAGNGGSAADCEHITGELMKKFKLSRNIPASLCDRLNNIDPIIGKHLSETLERGLMAIPLMAHEALSTAYLNDVDSDGVYAQQLLGYGRSGDVFLGISTSGNSRNIIYAAVLAKALGIKVIGLTGLSGGQLSSYADVIVNVPELETYKIQELHLPIYHCWCMMLEDYFFGE